MLAKIKRGLVVGGVTGVLVMLAYLLNAITGFDIFQIVSNFVTNTGWNASQASTSNVSVSEEMTHHDYKLGNEFWDSNYPYLVGVEISSYDGEIDWEAVAASGIDYALILSGYGTTEDDWFLVNLRGAKNAGLLVGVYHYSQCYSPESAAEEAEFLCSLLEGEKLDLPVFFDQVELMEYNGYINGCESARSFFDVVDEHGYQGGLLVREFHVDIYRDELQSLKDHPFLLVYYSEDIYHLNYSAACWEYSYNGKVPGIRGEVRMSKLWLP